MTAGGPLIPTSLIGAGLDSARGWRLPVNPRASPTTHLLALAALSAAPRPRGSFVREELATYPRVVA